MSTAKKIKAEKRREKPHLSQTAGAGKGRVFELSRDILSIGRTEDNEIVMKSDSVSRVHAYLKRSASGWMIQDNNSKNGIRVNGKKLPESTLKNGDQLGIGDFTFLFHDSEGPSHSMDMSLEKTRPEIAVDSNPVAKVDAIRSQVEKFQARSRNNSIDFAQAVKFLEQHSWVVGLVAGVLIGGGLWIKASRVAPRPGAVPEAAKAKSAPTARVKSDPATFASDKMEPADEKVTKAEMAVAPKGSKKPKSDIRDLRVYLKEGRDYLKEGDKESAAIAFRFAIVLSPNNKEALQGLRAAGVKVDLPKQAAAPKPEKKVNKEGEKKLKVADLLKGAADAFNKRSYQEAIDKAEAARKIEIKGQTEYLNEAKQIIDRAKQKQKEDYEPFLESALKKLAEGDFKASAALCEEMLRTDPAYAPARECLAKSLDGIAGRRVK